MFPDGVWKQVSVALPFAPHPVVVSTVKGVGVEVVVDDGGFVGGIGAALGDELAGEVSVGADPGDRVLMEAAVVVVGANKADLPPPQAAELMIATAASPTMRTGRATETG
jgi:hypothetical protein